jgi:hypothetical protein
MFTMAIRPRVIQSSHPRAVITDGVPTEAADRARRAPPTSRCVSSACRGDTHPGLTADLIDGVLGRAIDRLDGGYPAGQAVPAPLEFARRAIGIPVDTGHVRADISATHRPDWQTRGDDDPASRLIGPFG